MKDLGKLDYFLGVNVVQNVGAGEVFINQSTYVRSLLEKFNFMDAKPVKTPVDKSAKIAIDEDSEPVDKTLYQSAVGSLLYLSTKTRPDITFAVSNVAKYCSDPTKLAWRAVKRIFRYLCSTVDLGILYTKMCKTACVGQSDSAWAGDVKDIKSTSDYCFNVNGGLIFWRSSKQSCVALSTAEAKYVALAGAAQEAIWLRQLLNDVHCNDGLPIVINEYNQAAMSIAKDPKDHPKTKHIAIKYHFIRDRIVNNEIAVKNCLTDMMLADIFTKWLPPDMFVNLGNRCGMISYHKYIHREEDC